eukprot:TRINITY_DN3714_c0_g1_i2.p1 TRINITY_DN3714_c0_g1~~TRINITY_DN3714_c0_g1_i2.p1  ORF type:complete len:175 (-),score=53.76 TRINITY_DN3714_c0_g1_i2:49-573(-)
MGGIIAMFLAAVPGCPIEKLVLNDVGGFIPKAALDRIGTYVGKNIRFPSLQSGIDYLKEVHKPFGLTSEQWDQFGPHSLKEYEDGQFGLSYDQDIGLPFRNAPMQEVVLWPFWDNIQCPMMIVRGKESDLLLKETLEEMKRKKPSITVAEIEGIGHAPSLAPADQIQAVANFLF